ncbi:hypothetical protein BaRGS_00022597, partial [Batillaria attramentaria]
ILSFSFAVFPMIPDKDFVIRVNATCGSTPEHPTLITVLADLQEAEPLATCRDGHVFPLLKVSRIQWEIWVTTHESSNAGCTFQRRADVEIYSVPILVTFIPGLDDSALPPYLVTCVYAQHAKGSTSSSVVESDVTVSHVLHLVGPPSDATVQVLLMDVFDQPVTDAEIGQTSEKNGRMKAEYCYAVGESNTTYFILQNGCGDGVVVEKSKGFVTEGNHVTSPHFRFFGIPGSHTVTFNCLFVLCATDCDGVSTRLPQFNCLFVLCATDCDGVSTRLPQFNCLFVLCATDCDGVSTRLPQFNCLFVLCATDCDGVSTRLPQFNCLFVLCATDCDGVSTRLPQFNCLFVLCATDCDGVSTRLPQFNCLFVLCATDCDGVSTRLPQFNCLFVLCATDCDGVSTRLPQFNCLFVLCATDCDGVSTRLPQFNCLFVLCATDCDGVSTRLPQFNCLFVLCATDCDGVSTRLPQFTCLFVLCATDCDGVSTRLPQFETES